MDYIRRCTVIIESVQGEAIDLAENITYTVALAYDDGTRQTGIAGVRPDWPRWEAPLLIRAAPVGSRHPGDIRGPQGQQVLSAWILELPAAKPCEKK